MSAGLLYHSINNGVPAAIRHQTARALEEGIGNQGKVTLYFRADDLGVPGKNSFLLLNLFKQHQMPLNLAVVPGWLTVPRWEVLEYQAGKGNPLFCWHQHGWRHVNHEPIGKKQEFGPSRPQEQIEQDLAKGAQTLSALIGKRVCPVFTSPWNRCSETGLSALKNLGFKAVSMDTGGSSPGPGLVELPVHVDLHTQKEKIPEQGWQSIFKELTKGLESGQCGIMIHHRKMIPGAFSFLSFLLQEINRHPKISPLTFDALIAQQDRGKK
jgi:peptidoglycan/xylan/chitin deacetylase (PgdA/CDA1 family)